MMSPYAQMWLLLQLPEFALLLLWIGVAARWKHRGRWVLLAGTIALTLPLANDILSVLNGDLQSSHLSFDEHVRWTVLGILLLLTSAQRMRYSLRSAAVGMGYFVLEAWIPALVALGRGRLERERWPLIAALSLHAATVAIRLKQPLWAAEQLGVLGLGMDATTLLARMLSGAVEVGLWGAILFLFAYPQPQKTLPENSGKALQDS